MSREIEEWKKQAKSKQKNHKKLALRLKKQKGKHLDNLAEQTTQQVFSKVDCLSCANCCTSIPPMVSNTDTKRIAKFMGLKAKDFEEQFLTTDEDGDKVMKTTPCVFLVEGNKCDIYEVRPKACREYPHTEEQQFSRNLHLHAVNALYCPAVYHVLEKINQNVP